MEALACRRRTHGGATTPAYRQAPLKLLLLPAHPEQKPKPKKNFLCRSRKKENAGSRRRSARPIDPKVRVQTGRFRPISDRSPHFAAFNAQVVGLADVRVKFTRSPTGSSLSTS